MLFINVHGEIAHAFIKKGLVQIWPQKCTEVRRFSKRSKKKNRYEKPGFNMVLCRISNGIEGVLLRIILVKFVVSLDQPPDFVVTSVSDLFRLRLRKRLLMMENVVKLEMTS